MAADTGGEVEGLKSAVAGAPVPASVWRYHEGFLTHHRVQPDPPANGGGGFKFSWFHRTPPNSGGGSEGRQKRLGLVQHQEEGSKKRLMEKAHLHSTQRLQGKEVLWSTETEPDGGRKASLY